MPTDIGVPVVEASTAVTFSATADPAEDSLESRRELVKQLVKAEADLETAKHRLNNDRAYIKLLHDYNYLKVISITDESL